MVATVLKLVGFDLQRQLAWLKAQAEEFKDRTTDEIKHKAIDTGLTIGLAFGGLVLVLFTLIAGLIALYLWVAMERGPFVALGAVALTTTVLAALLFTVAATRGGSTKPKPKKPVSYAEAPPASSYAEASSASQRFESTPVDPQPKASLVEALTQDLTDRAHVVANEAMDSAVEVIRKSPREVLLAGLAVAIVTGVLLGRRH